MRSPTRSSATIMADLKDELGDLLLQVVFHARMAEEAGAFAFADVVDRDLRQDGAPPSAYLRRRDRRRPSAGKRSRPRSARPRRTTQRARRRRARPARAAARRKAAEARRARRLRLARCRAARAPRSTRKWPRSTTRRRRHARRRSATCCSRWSTGRAISASIPKPRCAPANAKFERAFPGDGGRSRGDAFAGLTLDAEGSAVGDGQARQRPVAAR